MGVILSGRDVPAYLERMNFFRLFGDRVQTNADVSSLEARQRHNPGTLQELINFQDEEEIPGIINRISEILEKPGLPAARAGGRLLRTLRDLRQRRRARLILFWGLRLGPAYQHIVSGRHGARTGERQGEEVLVAIADGGVGVRETLSCNPNLAEHHTTRTTMRYAKP